MTHPERPGANLVSPPRFELGPPGSRPATLPDYAMESLILNFSTYSSTLPIIPGQGSKNQTCTSTLRRWDDIISLYPEIHCLVS